MESTLEKFGIPVEAGALHLGVADGAAVGAGELLDVGLHVKHCICHSLQIVVVHALALKKYKKGHWGKSFDLFVKVRSLLNHFSHSTQSVSALERLMAAEIDRSRGTAAAVSGTEDDAERGGTAMRRLTKPLALKHYQETRWGAAHSLAKRLSIPEVTASVKRFCESPPDHVDADARKKLTSFKGVRLTDSEFLHLAESYKVLHPLQKLTVIFQGEHYVTASYYIYLLEYLRTKLRGRSLYYEDELGNKFDMPVDNLSDYGKTLRKRLKHLVAAKYPPSGYSEFDLIAMLLHPKLKTFVCLPDKDNLRATLLERAKAALKRVFLTYACAVVADANAAAPPPPSGLPPPSELNRRTLAASDGKASSKKKAARVIDEFDLDDDGDDSENEDSGVDSNKENEARSSPTEGRRLLTVDDLLVELDLYYGELVDDGLDSRKPMTFIKSFNCFQWWQERASKFKVLHRIALRFVAAPCASSFIERIFSTGGHLSSQCSPETVDARIRLSHNSHLLKDEADGLLDRSSGGMKMQLTKFAYAECDGPPIDTALAEESAAVDNEDEDTRLFDGYSSSDD
jgi:hypothetical protein